MGRKKIVWTEQQFRQFENLCALQCTEEEICSILCVTDKTLNRLLKEQYRMGFSEVYKRFSAPGKISLRRAQFRMAEHSDRMAIWLGKQYLGQREPDRRPPETNTSDPAAEWVEAVLASDDAEEVEGGGIE
ncbi:MAG: hypothetical protein LUF68_09375 [Clostridiales bacterium]|nr:hypothetical protein [Clostridiales bacterium]